MKTALQGLIEELEMIYEDEYCEIAKAKTRDCIITAKQYLEIEKQQIAEAYENGADNYSGSISYNYYSQNFNEQ